MDISASSQPPVSEKVKREVVVECSNCHTKNPVEALGAERASNLEDGLIEGILICPECGHETHSYWMSKELQQKKAEIFGKIAVLAKRMTPAIFKRMQELKEEYKNFYDAEKIRLNEILEKENGGST